MVVTRICHAVDVETASPADGPGPFLDTEVSFTEDRSRPAHPFVIRLFVGALIGFAGVSVLVGTFVTRLNYSSYRTETTVRGLLYILGLTVTAIGALLVTWSWSALGSRFGRVLAISIPGAWVAIVAMAANLYLWSGGGFGALALWATATYGVLWMFFGPLLVLGARRSAQRNRLADVPRAMTASGGRMTRFEKWLLIVTAFPGFTALLAVLLAQWID